MTVFDPENAASAHSDRPSESGKRFLSSEISSDHVDNFCSLRLERDNFDFAGFSAAEDALTSASIDVDALSSSSNERELLNALLKEFCQVTAARPRMFCKIASERRDFSAAFSSLCVSSQTGVSCATNAAPTASMSVGIAAS